MAYYYEDGHDHSSPRRVSGVQKTIEAQYSKGTIEAVKRISATLEAGGLPEEFLFFRPEEVIRFLETYTEVRNLLRPKRGQSTPDLSGGPGS